MKIQNLLFLPGASGDSDFWQPVARLMPTTYRCTLQAYPGFANCPARTEIGSLNQLSDWVIGQINSPIVIIAQSMGGIIAIQAALRKPDMVCGLVLAATSGGLDVSALGAADWRTDYALHMRHLPQWFVEAQDDFTPDLARILQPVLLLWGDADPISPVAVGHALQQQLPNAALKVIRNGRHDFAHMYAQRVGGHIAQFIQAQVLSVEHKKPPARM